MAPPERLYMAPTGTTLVAGLAGVPITTLAFDGGTDVISGDIRTITIDTVNGDAGCDLTAAPYDIDDCSRIQLSGISHGRIAMGAITTIDDGAGPGLDVYLLPSGARIDNLYQVAAGSFALRDQRHSGGSPGGSGRSRLHARPRLLLHGRHRRSGKPPSRHGPGQQRRHQPARAHRLGIDGHRHPRVGRQRLPDA